MAQHAMVIKSASGSPGSRLFTVDNPGLTHESNDTHLEFELLQLTVYIVELK